MYYFISTITKKDSTNVPSIVAYADLKDAEIKYHDEVSYALKLNTIKIANLRVVDEYGAIVNRLERTIEDYSEEPVEE